jgi:diadenosine tetraphosphate (Ap4A) HIT family hydrolase
VRPHATNTPASQDELVVALPDIRPAAAQHLLVLPRAHIPNVTSLAPANAQLGALACAAARPLVPMVLW